MPDEKLHAPNTKAGRHYNTEGSSTTAEEVAAFGSEADPLSVVDEYTLSSEERAEIGVRDDEQVIYAARNEIWPRRFAQLRQRYGEARSLVKNPTGLDACEHMDLHQVAVPKAAYEARMKRLEQQGKTEDAKYVEKRNNELWKSDELFDKDDKENLRMRREQNEQMFADMNIGESGPTSGMSLEDGIAFLERQGIDPAELADKARTGGHHRSDNQSMWQKAMQDKPRGGKQFAMGNSNIGKSTQEKVAGSRPRPQQNARANAR